MITSVAASEEVQAQDVNLCYRHRIVIYRISQKVNTLHNFLWNRRPERVKVPSLEELKQYEIFLRVG